MPGRRRQRDWLLATQRLVELQLDDADIPLFERRFAVAQIIVPEPQEFFATAELPGLVAVQVQRLSPAAERLGVVAGEILGVHQSQIGRAANRRQDTAQRWQAAARKNKPLNEIDRMQVPLVVAIGHDDCLQHQCAIGPQQPAALPEERIEIAVADGFDHLDRGEPVELSGQVAIVAIEQGDLPVHAGGRKALPGERELLSGYRSRGDAAAVLLCRMEGKAAPAAPDFQ